MVRPATLDRVENGDLAATSIHASEKAKEPNSTKQALFRPVISSLPPCSRLSRRGLETSEYASTAERRPALTASARAGVRNLRSGRKKACGAVEQKKGAETRKQERKRLRLWRRLESAETGFQIEQRNGTKKNALHCPTPLTNAAPYKGNPPGVT